MTKKYMVDFLTKIDESLNKGKAYKGGYLKGKNIKDHYKSLSKGQLQEEMKQWSC